MSEPRHRRHRWSAIRELRTPALPPRHADSIDAIRSDIEALLFEIGPGNPYRGGAR